MSRYSEDKSVSGESVLRSESVALTLSGASASVGGFDDSTIASSRLESAPASGAVSSASESAVLPSSAAAAKSEPDSFELYHLATRKTVLFTVRPGFDFNQRVSQETQETILHIVFKYDLEQCIQIMRDMGAIINSQYVQGATLDRFRALSRDKENGKIICQFLLDRGAKIDIRDSDGKTALDLAFIPGERGWISDMAEDLIKIYSAREGFDINARIFPGGETLFTKLVTHRTSPELVQYLIDRGGRLDSLNDKGENILDLIFRVDPKDMVTSHRLAIKKYVEFVGDVDRILLSERTPILHEAIKREDTDLIKFLASNGAQFHIPDSEGKTALELIYEGGRDRWITTNMLDGLKIYASREGFDINALLYRRGTTLLHEAIKRKDTNLIKFLASNGAQFHIPDSEGKTALDLLCEQSRPSLYYEVVDALKIYASREGFDINAAIYPGASTLLHQALKIGDENFVKFLIGKEARIDIRDSDGKTALDLALIPHKNGCLSNGARRFIINYVTTTEGFNINDTIYPGGSTLLHYTLSLDDSGLVKFLMGRGALVNIPDESGRTALDIALTPRADGGVFAGAYFIESYLDRPGNRINDVLNSEGETLLHISLRKNNLFLTGLLMDFNARVDIPDSSGITALDLAIRIGDDGKISAPGKSLIETYMDRPDFDPDAIIDSRTGETFLNFAARHNLPDLIQKIIASREIKGQHESDEGIKGASSSEPAAASSSAASDVLVVQSAPDDVSVATEVRLAEAHAALAKAEASAMTVTEREGEARVMDDDGLAAASDSALTGLSAHHEAHQDFFA